MSERSPEPAIALFGKLPSRRDFVHVGPQGTAEVAFQEWLGAAVEQSGGVLPAQAVRFLLAPEGADATLIGVWVPSRDQVGREFPLALAQRLPDELTQVPWSVVPAHYASFLDQSERCLRRASQEQLESLRDAVEHLERPHASALPRLWHEAQQALVHGRAAAFMARVCTPSAVDPLGYALSTLERAVALDGDAPTLDLPSASESDLFVWLELLRCLAGEARPRALVWALETGRALVCMGTLSEQLIAFLINPQHKSNRRWPVWTESAAAGPAARAGLSERARRALEPDLTLSELVLALTTGGRHG